jgi:hypothetical protein
MFLVGVARANALQSRTSRADVDAAPVRLGCSKGLIAPNITLKRISQGFLPETILAFLLGSLEASNAE